MEAVEPRNLLAGDPVTLSSPNTVSTPGGPRTVEAADLNADGIPDLVSANYGGNNVSVFRGNGDGTFAGQVNTPVNGTPKDLAVGDVNGDGRPDVAALISNYNSTQYISVLLTNSDGSLAPAVNYAVGASAESVILGDFNGDGKLDLAASYFHQGSGITFWFGTGNGTFTGGNALSLTDQGIIFVQSADLNGDGKLDLVASDAVNNLIRVLTGNGNGTFTPAGTYSTGAYPMGLTIADYDRDGKLDVISGNYFGNNITYFRGQGNATFQAGVTTALGGAVRSLKSGDLNGDGILDLAIALETAQQLNVLTGNGDGTFNSPQSFPAGADTFGVVLGDLDGNGTLDVAATNATSNTLQSWLNTGVLPANPHLSISTLSTATGSAPFNVTVTARDANNNVATSFTGAVRFASSDRLAGLPANYTFVAGDAGVKTFAVTPRTPGRQTISATLVGSTPGIFAASVTTVSPAPVVLASTSSISATPAGPRDVETADLNADGIPDLISANNGVNNVSVFRGNGDGTFAAPVSTPVNGGAFSLAVGDFNGDGRPDVATVQPNTNTLSVLLTNSDGSLALAVNYAAGNFPVGVTTGDFNGDGNVDLATADFDESSGITFWYGTGTGTFTDGNRLALTVNGTHFVRSADLNGDGKADLVTADAVNDVIRVQIGNGNGTFQSAVSYATSSYAYRLNIADFDRDGKLDVISGNYFGNNITYFRGQGNGTFQAGVSTAVGGPVRSMTSGDLNGDGILDLAIASDSPAHQLKVMAGNGDGTFIAPQNFTAGTDPHGVALGDWDGNGTLDVAIVNATSNTLQTRLNTGVLPANPHLSISVPGTAIVGKPFNVTVTALDSSNNVLSGFTGTVRFASSDRFAGLPANYTFATGDAGVKTFAVTPRTPGSQTLSATLVGSTPGVFAARATAVAIAPVVLSSTSTVTTPNRPVAVETADLNADGIPDLISVNGEGKNVSVFRGNGDGSFAGPMNTSINGDLTFLTLGDFNGDGRPDVATVQYTTNTLSVLLTNSDGSLSPPVYYAVGPFPLGVTTGDFNGDGKLDLAAANFNESSGITFWFGTGNGTFTGGNFMALAGQGIYSVRSADLNGDGKLDIVATDAVANVIRVLTGNGNGIFTAAGTYSTGVGPLRLTIADFDRDGKLDVISGNHDGNSLTYFRGQGNGTFQAGVSTAVDGPIRSITSGDVNGDGILDVAIASDFPAAELKVMTGNGDGSFNAPQNFVGGADPHGVTLSDWDGNGTLDVAIVNYASNSFQTWSNTGVLPANPHLSISVPANAVVGTPFNVTVTARDASNNVATNFTGTVQFASSDRLAGLPGDYTFQPTDNGAKTFSITPRTGGSQTVSATLVGSTPSVFAARTTTVAIAPVVLSGTSTTATPNGPKHVETADLNADGIPDLISVNDGGNNVSVFRGVGDGTFASAVHTPVSGSPFSLTVGDFNGDGRPDVATVQPTASTLSVLLTNSDGNFAPGVSYATGNHPVGVTTGDFNADGKLDLVTTNYNAGSLTFWFGTGSGTFTGGSAQVVTNLGPRFIRSADLNGDGKADLVVADAVSNVMRVLTGNGNGTFTPAGTYAAGAFPVGLSIADFDRDGKLDVISANQQGNNITYFRGQGDGTFRAGVSTALGNAVAFIRSGDLNGDGILDLALASDTDQQLKVVTGNGDGTFKTPQNFTAGTDPSAVALGDWDGNGTLDVAVVNATSNTLQTWSNTGVLPANPHLTISVPNNAALGLPGVVTVTARDGENSVLSDFTGKVHFASSDSLATLPADYTFTTADQGIKTFNVILRSPGSQTISATLVGSSGIFAGALANTLQPAAWYRAEGNANDSVGSNNGLFQSGSSFAPGKFGQAFSFNGNNAVNIFKTNSVFTPGSENFTIAGWIKYSQSLDPDGGVIYTNYGGAPLINLFTNSNQRLELSVRNANDVVARVTGTKAVGDNQWHHVAGVRQGSQFSIYVDGQLDSQLVNASVGPVSPPNQYVRIGGTYTDADSNTAPTANSSFYVGLIDELGYFQRALTLQEIQALAAASNIAPTASPGGPYTAAANTLINLSAAGSSDAEELPANLSYSWDLNDDGVYGDATGISPTFSPIWVISPATVPISVKVTDSNGASSTASTTLTITGADNRLSNIRTQPEALYRAEGNANDSAGTHHGTFVGGGGTTSGGKLGQAFSFNSVVGQYVSIPDQGTLQPQLFTATAWVNALDVGSFNDSQGPIILTKDQISGDPFHPFAILGPGNAGRFTFILGFTNGVRPVLQSTDTFAFGQWHHVAMTWDGTTMRGYVDGRLQAQQIVGATSVYYNPAAIWGIGAHTCCSSRAFNGEIDEVGLYPRAMTPLEIQTLATAFNTPPVANPGGPYIANPGSSVTMDASGSTDVEESASALTFSWDLNNDGIYGDATGVNAVFDATSVIGPQTLSVGLKATDSNGGFTFGTGSIVVPAINAAETPQPRTDDLQLNSDVTTGDQANPAVAMVGASGDFVVNWEDSVLDGNGNAIASRQFSSSGAASTSTLRRNDQTVSDQMRPDIASNAAGAIAEAWTTTGVSPQQIHYKVRPAGNSSFGSELNVQEEATNQSDPRIAMQSNGSFVIVWRKQLGAVDSGVYAQRFSATGARLTGSILISDANALAQDYPEVNVDSNNNIIIAWHSNGQDGSGFGVYARRYSASLTPLGSEFRVNSITANDQLHPRIGVGPAGTFVIAWSSTGQDGSGRGVYAQRFDASGNRLGNEFRANTFTAGDQEPSGVAVDPVSGDFLINWYSPNQDGSGYGMYSRLFTASGIAKGNEFLVNQRTAGDQVAAHSSVAFMPSGGSAVFVWHGATTLDSSGNGIGGRIFATANLNRPPTDIVLSSASVFENSPSGTSVGTLSSVDPDAGNTFTYLLVSGIGSTDNASFSLVGNELRSNSVFDFEAKSSYTVRIRTIDNGGQFFEKAVAISVTNVNEPPVRTAGSPTPINVNKNIAINTAVTVGLSALNYSPGGGVDEASQTLTYKVNAIPFFVTVFKGDGATPVTAGAPLTLSELQGLTYKTMSDAIGTANLTWTVQDNGGTANGGVDTLTENLSITVFAVNAPPVRTAGSPTAINANEDSARTTAVTLGLSAVAYDPGASDEASQTLSYRVTAIPAFLTVLKADGVTAVTAGAPLTLAELQGLKYKTVADANGTSNLTWTVQDNGGTSNGGVDTLTENLSITVIAVNDAPSNNVPNSQYVPFTGSRVFSSANNNLISITDVDAGSGAMQVRLTVSRGALSLVNTTGVTFTAGGNNTATMTINGALSNLNGALAGMTFTPTSNYRGLDILRIVTSDLGSTGTGGTLTATTNVTLEVGAIFVTTTSDASNGATSSAGELVSGDGGDGISLREAITAANNSPGTDYIYFNVNSGPQTINLASALPDISGVVVIDGSTQTGFSSLPIIELNGSAAGAGVDGLHLAPGSGGSIIRGLVINRFHGNGILVNTDNNIIAGNYLGLSSDGTSDQGNDSHGISLVNASGNILGGGATADRNIISGNLIGVSIEGTNANNNVVAGNFIGTNVLATAAIGNEFGIVVKTAQNRIGTDGDGVADVIERNVISGNQVGINITGAGADQNVVAGNYIGITADGNAALRNTFYGMVIQLGADRNRVGTNGDGVSDTAERNVISGNGLDGVVLTGDGVTANVIAGNFIGANRTGTAPLGNGRAGVSLGVSFDGATFGNRIGTNGDGVNDANEANIIAFNGAQGIRIVGISTAQNAILGNAIHNNGGLGIDLNQDGVTASDAGDDDTGPNNLQNFPSLSSAVIEGANLRLVGTLNSSPSTRYRIEFFANPAGDPTGYGEGQTYLGFFSVTTDSTGNASFNSTLAGVSVPAGFRISATATLDNNGGVYGSTSEFAQNIVVQTQPSAAIAQALSVSAPNKWHNTSNRYDVDADRQISPSDALEIIDFLNTNGSVTVPFDGQAVGPYYDVNGDGNVAPDDVLAVINRINAVGQGEGEAEAVVVASPPSSLESLLSIIVLDIAIQKQRGRPGTKSPVS